MYAITRACPYSFRIVRKSSTNLSITRLDLLLKFVRAKFYVLRRRQRTLALTFEAHSRNSSPGSRPLRWPLARIGRAVARPHADARRIRATVPARGRAGHRQDVPGGKLRARRRCHRGTPAMGLVLGQSSSTGVVAVASASPRLSTFGSLRKGAGSITKKQRPLRRTGHQRDRRD